MDVTHLEAGSLSRKSSGPEGAQSPLVGDLAQRIGLVHKLAQLAGAEKLFDHC